MLGHAFDAVLVGQDDGPGCGFELPFNPREVFGKARAPVRVSVDGGAWFRTTVAIYGGSGWIGLRKDQRVEFGVDVGDAVRIRIARDDEPRLVEVPAELEAALAADPEAKSAFDALSYSHRKEYAGWVAEAKRQETRDDRAARTVQKLRASA
ncbi:YdeI/OmpD-associated family protein [Phytoactinopolyspora limicola]|uniref:YdeI/OmpD-associated family protein n=1 Tax=Phytoactinopolyspora limicola TaxID=2715536 RepID=UPI0014096B3A|nr:YdeI/OmpD-associated family protein [Phytoactinopolyspora limicola]